MNSNGHRLFRRSFVQAGVVGSLSLASFLKCRQAVAEQKQYHNLVAKAESVIHLFLPGGIAQQESFDPKPYSPSEFRGELNAIRTKTGEQFSELFPKLAECADKLTVIRSMTHGEAAHERGIHNMFTGYKPSPAVLYPSFGSVVSHEYGPRNDLPPYICIPTLPNEFANNGYLSSSYAPFSLGSDPADSKFEVRDLELPKDVTVDRFHQRKAILEIANKQFTAHEHLSDPVGAMDTFYERAFSLLNSEKARAAFQLEKEGKKGIERYGKSQAGQRLLLARRLVEAGVRFVTVTYGSWDMHADLTRNFQTQAPPLDHALSTLLNDLDERGLLDSTLVMVTSEFGRTPKFNPDAGRDHWPKVFSVLMAGGGIKRGLTYGLSDPTASEPADRPVSPADLATTMYHLLGIVADKELMSPGNRPLEIVDGGQVIRDIVV